jgi:hypothetical protein
MLMAPSASVTTLSSSVTSIGVSFGVVVKAAASVSGDSHRYLLQALTAEAVERLTSASASSSKQQPPYPEIAIDICFEL